MADDDDIFRLTKTCAIAFPHSSEEDEMMFAVEALGTGLGTPDQASQAVVAKLSQLWDAGQVRVLHSELRVIVSHWSTLDDLVFILRWNS
jgi:hypothetical protein